MKEDDLVQLVRRVTEPDDDATEDGVHEVLERFIQSIPHPGGSDLIFYPENWGLGSDPSPEDIARAALSWRPTVTAMSVAEVRAHPSRSELFCCVVEVKGRMRTQVLSSRAFRVGDHCAVALSGVRLPNGTQVKHGFIDGVFTAGEILGLTSEPVGNELPNE